MGTEKAPITYSSPINRSLRKVMRLWRMVLIFGGGGLTRLDVRCLALAFDPVLACDSFGPSAIY